MRLVWPCMFVVACGARSVRDGLGTDEIGTDADSDTDSTTGTGEGELDLGSDARPSDYPEADDWTDADPSAIEGEPCCELVGDPIGVDDAGMHSRGGLVAWNGSGWGVAWTTSWYGSDGQLLFQPLDPDGARAGGTTEFETGDHSFAFDLEWGWDRYGVTVYTPRGTMNAVTMLGEGGENLTGWTMLAEDASAPSIARYVHGGGWVVTYERETGGYDTPLEVVWVDDDGTIDGEPKSLGTTISSPAPVVGLASRAAAVWAGDLGIQFRSFSWPEVEGEPPDFPIVRMATTEDTHPDIVAYRDYAAVGVAQGGDATVTLVDPWENEIVAGPGEVGTADAHDGGAVVRLASAEDRGFLGACWVSHDAVTPDDVSEISFGLVGPDATPWGVPVVVVRHAMAGGCTAAWNGEEFLVLYWLHGEESSVWVQRIRPGV